MTIALFKLLGKTKSFSVSLFVSENNFTLLGIQVCCYIKHNLLMHLDIAHCYRRLSPPFFGRLKMKFNFPDFKALMPCSLPTISANYLPV